MSTDNLYNIPKADQDVTRFMWSAMGLFLMIIFVSCGIATQYIAYEFGYDPALGKPMLPGQIYFPFSVLIWIWNLGNPKYGVAVNHIINNGQLILAVGAIASLLIPVTYAYRRSRKMRSAKNDLHGSAHWATTEEAYAAGVVASEKNQGGVLFGALNEKGKVNYLRHKGPEHMMVFAPTRSGKGVGIVIPTLLSWDESVLIHDIKGENWALTSGFRQKILGQRVIKFDPTDPGSARFNPLDEIRMDGNLVKDVQNISTMIVDPDGKGLVDHWAKTGFDLMTGVLLFILLYYPKGDPNRCLQTVQAILSDGGPIRKIADEQAKIHNDQGGEEIQEGAAAVMTYIRDTANEKLEDGSTSAFYRVGWGAVAQASQSYLNKASNEASGVLSTALSFLSLYRDPIVADNTRFSDFSLESLMGGSVIDGVPQFPKTSLYLVVPPSDKDRLKPLLRLVINQVVRRLTEGMEFNSDGSGKSKFPHKLLLLIDEFPSLGKLDIFQEALAFIAGYGLKALLIIQDLSQLNAAYGRDESIISNCHIRIAYAPNKVETAEVLSKMAGQSTVSHTQRQYSGNRLSIMLGHVNTNEQIVQRPLLTPDECMRLPEPDEIVFAAGHAPIYCQKIKYYQDANFVARVKLGVADSTGRGSV
ncbi:type IV secretory system conjugative DNA transfer family protein [Polynucleobacter sp. Fuers-14]|uniref:type IV secretory system conjugative DNA transfer family protein n=1 Tax=Polynucleobacter sp. Fuers-14 TaxID=1758364 RepID=UPI001C0B9360|nr:type IV secretory system conjugative DNA transfer family protein [Polynucleobacter sp. Fuers-14]MBU3641002.1 type IV secretory system conjugative DNA transfer family protein [Polynucleobacter sp. Fuers-14]